MLPECWWGGSSFFIFCFVTNGAMCWVAVAHYCVFAGGRVAHQKVFELLGRLSSDKAGHLPNSINLRFSLRRKHRGLDFFFFF